MSEFDEINQEGNEESAQQSQSNEDQSNREQSKEDYLLEQKRSANNEAKQYRLQAEKLQSKLDEIEKTKNEAELDATEKLKARDAEVAELKASMERNKLTGQFIQDVTEAGIPAKLAKMAVPSDLSEDNLKDHIKAVTKDLKEFVKTEDPKNRSSLSNVQPGNTTVSKDKGDSISDLLRGAAGQDD